MTETIRTADNVWLEIESKCLEHMRATPPMPISTYGGVENYITNVSDRWIERHSTSPRAVREHSRTPKADVVKIWESLVRRGHTEGVRASYYFSFALIHRLIDGVSAKGAAQLYFSDRERAMEMYQPARGPVLSVRERLLGDLLSVQTRRHGGQRWLHKPLLLLLALGRCAHKEGRMIPFSETEEELTELLHVYDPSGSSAAEPFWRLQSDGDLWVLEGEGLDALRAVGGVPTAAELRSHRVRGGLSKLYYDVLIADKGLIAEAVGNVITTFFPDVMWEAIDDQFGFSREIGRDTTPVTGGWRQKDVFPLIARTIRNLYQETHDWITREAIQNRLLLDAEAKPHIEESAERLHWQPVAVAANMVDWWSARYRSGSNGFASEFDRTALGGKAAYRPK